MPARARNAGADKHRDCVKKLQTSKVYVDLAGRSGLRQMR